MDDYTLAAAVVAFSATLTLIAILSARKPFNDIPGPPSPSWIYGNMLQLILDSPYGKYEFEWQNTYGTVYAIKGCLGENRLMVSDPTALREILSDTGEFRKSPQHQFINRNVFGYGSVLYAHGSKHRRIRSVMAPVFSTGVLRTIVPSLQVCAQSLVEKWEHHLGSLSSGVLDIFQDLHETTLRGVSKCIMGSDVTLDKEYAQIYENLVETGAKRSKHSILSHSTLLLLPEWMVDIVRLVPSPDFRKLLKHHDASQDRAEALLDSKLEAQKLGLEPDDDLFEIMYKAHSGSPDDISTEEIKDQFGTITVAGEDTTANGIIWVLYILATHPQWQQRLREEVTAAYENSGKEFNLNFYDSLLFLNALIKETMRLYSPLPYTERIAIKDTVISLSQPIISRTGKKVTEISVKKGQYVEVAISSYNRLPSIWGPDAGQFNPLRWLDQGKKIGDNALGPYSNLLTFLGGPRTCLGWRFAILETQVVVTELVRKFDFSLPKDSVIETAHAISLVPIHNHGKTELPLRISPL